MRIVISLLFVLLVLPFNVISAISFDTNGKWETTFDCDTWTDPETGGSCDDLDLYYASPNGSVNQTQITVDANNTNGSGEKGIRFWVGDGDKNLSSPVYARFSSGQPEVWIRYYTRWQTGFEWSGGNPNFEKSMYIRTYKSTDAMLAGDPSAILGYGAGNNLHLSNQGGSPTDVYPNSDEGWTTIFPSQISDGRWYCTEVYLKMNTTDGSQDGIGRIWIDGVLKVESTTTNWNGTSTDALQGFMHTMFRSNQSWPDNGQEMYIDYDDIVIYNQTPPNTDAAGNAFIGMIDTVPTPINGACGTADGGTFSELTASSDNLVVAGTTVYGFLETAGVGWTWGSLGADNGGTATDTAIDACSATYQESAITDPITGLTKGTEVFSESFENDTWTTRSWYDGTTSTGSTVGGYSGNALKWTWASAAQQPTGFTSIRNNISQAVDEFLVEYYIKYDSGWQGSGQAYHPHLMHILSSDDTAYQGFAASNSNLYFETIADITSPYANYPTLAHQDLVRAVSATNDLTGVTETRSANTCDTPYVLTGATDGACYDAGGWYSANVWKSQSVSIPENEWVKITAYIKMNTFTTGTGNFDGIMKLWVNADLAINSETVLYAAGAYEGSMWDKIALGPYIGDGSPIAQSMWLDELSVWTIDSGTPETPGTITAYSLLDGSVLPYKLTTE